jgi:hypothetical protein
MYIISKFKDYYDTAMGSAGTDKKLIYNRETKVGNFHIEGKPVKWGKKSGAEYLIEGNRWYNFSNSLDTQLYFIGFCGKIYPLIRQEYRIPKKFINSVQELGNEFIYDKEKINDILQKHNYFNNWNAQFSNLDEMIQKIESANLFIENKTTSFILSHFKVAANFWNNYGPEKEWLKWTPVAKEKYNIITNPQLKTFEFFRVVDPYQAFQEISMYLGGVLGTEGNGMVEISDKDKILQYGFDLKTSFRKDKQKKK